MVSGRKGNGAGEPADLFDAFVLEIVLEILEAARPAIVVDPDIRTVAWTHERASKAQGTKDPYVGVAGELPKSTSGPQYIEAAITLPWPTGDLLRGCAHVRLLRRRADISRRGVCMVGRVLFFHVDIRHLCVAGMVHPTQSAQLLDDFFGSLLVSD